MFVKNPNLGADPNLGDFTVSYVKIDHKFNYRVPHLTADICKTIIGRSLEIVLIERAVNFTQYNIS